MNHHYTPEFLARFWSKVDRSDNPESCWQWTGSLNEKGYGKIKLERKSQRAHRISFELAYGPYDDTLLVLHKCDNPKCCNPNHLFLGTHGDNMRDKSSKGRDAGERNPSCKLPDNQVPLVRELYAQGNISYKALGERFGISPQQVWRIVKGKQRQRH